MRPSNHLFGRSEKYHRRARHLYALLFDGNRVYVGQSVDARRRWRQHAKAWPERFSTVALETVDGTMAEAVEYEHAWRLVAERAGYQVLGGPGMPVKAWRRSTPRRSALASARRWPLRRRSPWPAWIWAAAVVGLLVAAWLISRPHPWLDEMRRGEWERHGFARSNPESGA